ncbi:MAG: hypothetical protein R2706_15835 [Acidimicrobiales bacterium]
MAISDVLKDFIQNVLGDPEAALAYSIRRLFVGRRYQRSGPSDVDLSQTVAVVSNELNLPEAAHDNLTQVTPVARPATVRSSGSGSSGSGSSGGGVHTAPPLHVFTTEQTINGSHDRL